jgi:hypothetical protein
MSEPVMRMIKTRFRDPLKYLPVPNSHLPIRGPYTTSGPSSSYAPRSGAFPV